MSTPARVGAYGAALLVTFALAYGLGAQVEPLIAEPVPPPHHHEVTP